MKLKKAMKKFKFWSSKKTKKKDNYYYEYYHKLLPPPQYDFYPYIYHSPPPRSPTSSMPPPPPEGCECHFCHPAEPSAPPLPSWLESQLQEGHHSDYDDYSNSSNSGINPEVVNDDCIRISQEIVGITTSTDSETNTSGGNIQDTDETGETIDSSNLESQKEFPKSSEKDVAVGLFGCIIDVSALLFRCLNISDRPRRYNFNCSALPQKALTHQTTPLLMASGDVKE